MSSPPWIAVIGALLTPTIAASVAIIAFLQWRTAQRKMVLDLFDRRLDTYTALREVVSRITASSSNATPEPSFEFLKAVDRAEFLFGTEVVDHLRKIDLAINDIRIALEERKALAAGPELEANTRRERAAREVVASFYTSFQQSLARYLRMDQRMPIPF